MRARVSAAALEAAGAGAADALVDWAEPAGAGVGLLSRRRSEGSAGLAGPMTRPRPKSPASIRCWIFSLSPPKAAAAAPAIVPLNCLKAGLPR